jgi:hypothetical protein
MDAVIIPTYNRPAMTWVCAEHIAACNPGPDKQFWICEDHEPGEDVNVAVNYAVELFNGKRIRYPYPRRMWDCIWSALHDAYATDARYVCEPEKKLSALPKTR